MKPLLFSLTNATMQDVRVLPSRDRRADREHTGHSALRIHFTGDPDSHNHTYQPCITAMHHITPRASGLAAAHPSYATNSISTSVPPAGSSATPTQVLAGLGSGSISL
jgi:hypothetical protein